MIRALTLTPPWDWLILHAGKNPENRVWPTQMRGWFLIHAATGAPMADYASAVIFAENAGFTGKVPAYKELVRGHIVGAARIVDCISYERQRQKGLDLRWSIPGQYGFFLADVIALPPVPVKGALSFWNVPGDVRRALVAECDKGGVVLADELRRLLVADEADEPVKKQMGLFDG